MLKKSDTPIVTFAMLLLLAASPYAGGNPIGWNHGANGRSDKVEAQTAARTFPIFDQVAPGTKIQMVGSDATSQLRNNLKQQFERHYNGSQLENTAVNSDAALLSVSQGRADIGVVGRSLTPSEREQGLATHLIGRQKIAIVTHPDNAFTGSLSNEQFAKIFRGEITNWSQVGGPNQPIQVIDQTNDSDTRMALSNYPVFKAAPFEVAANATKLTQNDAEAIAGKLTPNSIGFLIADQALGRSDVKILPLHQVLPDDARYSFSQPLSYVYKGPEPNSAAAALLGYATASEGQRLAQIPGATATSNQTTNPTTTAPNSTTFEPLKNPPPGRSAANSVPWNGATTRTDTNQSNRGNWGWWLVPLLGLPALGALWLLGRRREDAVMDVDRPVDRPISRPTSPALRTAAGLGTVGAAVGTAAGAAAMANTQRSRVILVPRDCRHAYAYWEINDRQQAELQSQGGKDLKLRLYRREEDGVRNLVQEFVCQSRDHDCQIPIAQDHQDYFVELGYITDSGQWLSLASSAPVQVPACERSTAAIPLGMAGAGIAAAGAAGITAGAAKQTDRAHQRSQVGESRLIFVPRQNQSAYAYWEIPRSQLQHCPAKLQLRLYDVTHAAVHDPLPQPFQAVECAVSDHDCDLRLPADNRDYIAELGYRNPQGQWVSIARSERTHAAATSTQTQHPSETNHIMDTIAQRGRTPIGNDSHAGLVDRAVSGEDKGRLVILSQIPQRITVGAPVDDEPRAYVYWDIPESRKQTLQRQGGRQMVLRVYDATAIDLDRQAAHSFRQYPISDTERDMVVSVPAGDRDYVAEIGYLAPGGKLMPLLRSTHTRVPVTQHH